MSSAQKWLLILALWVLAIGVLISSFRGRYSIRFHETKDGSTGYVKQDTWTGRLSVYQVTTFKEDDHWQVIK